MSASERKVLRQCNLHCPTCKRTTTHTILSVSQRECVVCGKIKKTRNAKTYSKKFNFFNTPKTDLTELRNIIQDYV